MLTELVKTWRSRSATLAEHAADGAARAYREAAAELEAALHADAAALLTVKQAAETSHYNERTIRRWLRSGRLENHGKLGAPLVRSGDLPRKLVRPLEPQFTSTDRADIARSILNGTV